MAAAAAAVLPVPAGLVERYYSSAAYLLWQNVLTRASNVASVAILDVAVGILAALAIAQVVRSVRARGVVRALGRAAATAVVGAAAVYLLFLISWGLNYRRVPLERKLHFDASRLSPESAVSLGETAAAVVNGTYAAAHAAAQGEPRLEDAFARAQQLLGAGRLAVPGRPKRSVLEWYFPRAAVDGMTDPFFLEIILNPDLLVIERPFVIAHEWAHLAGYADESEASFVGWLTCALGNARARYSGWLSVYQHVSGRLPQGLRAELDGKLDEGPRSDLRAIAERYRTSAPLVRHAARDVYDAYLKANRVEAGIESYDEVVRLILGSVGPGGEAPDVRLR